MLSVSLLVIPLIILMILMIYLSGKLIQYLYNDLYPKLKGFTRKETDKLSILESIIIIIIFGIVLNISKKLIACLIHGKCK